MSELDEPTHPKAVRRKLMRFLYERYLNDPLEMLSPEDFLENLALSRRELMVNMHYLGDRRLAELMMGYNPPMFAAARITANGIDLVENRYEFDLRFPPELGQKEEHYADLPRLIEDLVEQAELSALDGEARAALLRDVQFLRDEIARPATRWRHEVLDTVLGWIEGSVAEAEESLPVLSPLRERLIALKKS